VHVRSPSNERGWNWNDTLIFEHGKFENTTIDEFRVHAEGVVVNTRTSVELADAFIDDVLAWFFETYDYVVKKYPPIEKFFFSNLEVHIDHDVSGLVKDLASIARLITQKLEEYETHTGEFVPSGLSMNFDPASYKGANPPGQFTIERKLNCPYDQHLYVSSAPLKTDDHLEVLDILDSLLERIA